MARAPVFIVGPPRSGTTLVAGILGNHPDVYAPAPGETYFFDDVWTRKRELGDLETAQQVSKAIERVITLFGRYDNPQMQTLVDQSIGRDQLLEHTMSFLVENPGLSGYGALYHAFTAQLAENAGKKRYCDDTPKHLFHLHTIFALLPEALVGGSTRAIACVRDARDFLSSYKNWWKKSIAGQRIKHLYHPIITSLLWNSSINLIRRHAYGCCQDRLMIVQYETLVKQPVSEIQRICNFLSLPDSGGAPVSEAVITCWIDNLQSPNSSFDANIGSAADRPGVVGTDTGIFSTSVDRWKDHLSPEEVWWAQRLTKRNLQSFNYSLANVHPSMAGLLSVLSSFPSALIRAVRSAQRGPLVPYLAHRLGALFDKG
jgi:hypothetical protein